MESGGGNNVVVVSGCGGGGSGCGGGWWKGGRGRKGGREKGEGSNKDVVFCVKFQENKKKWGDYSAAGEFSAKK
tara:strand:+ start:962 stop:1183 length:222 start_codon:yes stop_codon:yes gene_type:complete